MIRDYYIECHSTDEARPRNLPTLHHAGGDRRLPRVLAEGVLTEIADESGHRTRQLTGKF
ncbi:hypothetical protein [Streptomyces sp. HUAS TT20]|uniref:hypothetical protein n=1 Tax=Streptomyces sp. HUAS TT20 TaxID=3447509 RepID=UPI0021DB3212|nr:hypothetical protein [Streptomyces sp. HUAS 15-9]UXY32439.1 hypothetical protein N8I87_42160 [Streptomyces sp. HUAS 15-9]